MRLYAFINASVCDLDRVWRSINLSSHNLSCIKKGFSCTMAVGWVWLFLGLKQENRSRNRQVPPPRSLWTETPPRHLAPEPWHSAWGSRHHSVKTQGVPFSSGAKCLTLLRHVKWLMKMILNSAPWPPFWLIDLFVYQLFIWDTIWMD